MYLFKSKSKSKNTTYEDLKNLLSDEEVEIKPLAWFAEFQALGFNKSAKDIEALHVLASERIHEKIRESLLIINEISCELSYDLAQAYLFHRYCVILANNNSLDECKEQIIWDSSVFGLEDAHIVIINTCGEDTEIKLSDEHIEYIKQWKQAVFKDEMGIFSICCT
jgi:hypothetical protein